jgi:phosphotriesterase-related protein
MAGVMTVRGPVPPDALGMTLVHEHLLCDLRALWHAPPDDRPDLLRLVDADPTIRHRGPLCADPYVCRPNLLLDDPALAIEEIGYFRDAGGGTLVELTTAGLGPRPAGLRRISQASGVHIVAGCGWYRRVTSPPGLEDPEAVLAERLLRAVVDGFPASAGGADAADAAGGTAREAPIRPGIIGEIGTGDPIHPDEAKALRAAARVQRQTGLAIAVHLALWGRQGEAALDILEAAGADPTRVLLCHLSEQPDAAGYHRALLARGACLGFDTFGAEYSLDGAGRRLATDEERLGGLVRLLDAGYVGQVFVSQDVCERLQLRAYGGYGYAHLLTTIRPRLRRAGVDDATIDRLLRANPARLLTVGA